MKVFVIADRDTCLAFSLAGFRTQTVQSADEVPAVLAGISHEEVGLILVTEALAEKNRQMIERMLTEPGRPLILDIPGASGPLKGRIRATERFLSLLKR